MTKSERRQDQALEGIDASFLYAETASVVMQTVKVLVFAPGSAIGFDRSALRAAVATTAKRLPALRRVLVTVPLRLHHPRWIDVEELDVDAHLKQVELGEGALERLVGEAAELRLPRHRPLWRLTLVTGLHERRLAAIVTLHHSVADGAAARGLLEVLTQSEPGEWTAPALHGDRLGTRRPPWLHLLWRAFAARVRSLAVLPKLLWTSLRGSLRARGSTDDPRAAKLFAGPRTFFNRSLGRTREYTQIELPLADLSAIKAGFGVTLNDVLLALASGAFARLRGEGELRGPSLVCAMPVGTNSTPGPTPGPSPELPRLEGNRVANALVELHDDLPEPAARVRAIAGSTRAAKRKHLLRGPRRLIDWAEFDAPMWQPLIWSIVRRFRRPPLNLIISNMRGPSEARYCGRARIDQLWSVGPLVHRVGLNLTAWSYAGAVHLSLLADGGQWTRAQLLRLRAGLADECAVLRAQVSAPGWSAPASGADAGGTIYESARPRRRRRRSARTQAGAPPPDPTKRSPAYPH